jgi:UMF1 family MFS transporter
MFRSWNRTELSWAFYDWANSTYALIVITAFFPVFLSQQIVISGSLYSATSTLGFANSAASLVVVLLAPVFGALGDQYGARRKLLAAFALLGILATAALGLVESGWPLLAAFVFACGNIGFYVANGLYDSLLVSVTTRDKLDRLSALGFSLGYLGSLLLFMLGLAMTMKPDWFGFNDMYAAMRATFLISALWWLVFTIPLLVTSLTEVPPLGNPEGGVWRQVRGAFVELKDTLREIRQYRNAAIFLLAYFFYMDGVYTVIKMAVVYAEARGFDPMVPMIGIVIVQVIAIPATLAYGRLAGRFGARRMILIGVFAYLIVTGGAPLMYLEAHFYLLAVVIGLAQGGLQSISRSLFARLIPESEPGKYFGFYNMVGKFSAVLGPFLMAVMAIQVGERYSIVAIPVLLIMGMLSLWFVTDEARGRTTLTD